MPPQQTMSQDEVLALLGKTREPARSLDIDKPLKKRGDGSRYGKREVKGQMNKTEAEFALICESRKRNGEIVHWMYHAVTFVLADGLRWTPDFVLLFPDFVQVCVDTKGAGPISDTSLAKIKMAAKTFFWITFVIEQKKKDGWHRRVF